MSNNISNVAVKPKSAALSVEQTPKCNHLLANVMQFKIDYDEAVLSDLPYRLNGIECFIDGDIYANFTPQNMPKSDDDGFINAVIYNGQENINVKIEAPKNNVFSDIKSTVNVYVMFD